MKKINCDIVVITHKTWNDGKRKRGGLDKIVDYFTEQEKKIIIIEHPLEGLKEKRGKFENEFSIITLYEKGKPEEIERKNIRSKFRVLSWIRETFFNITFLLKKVTGKPILFSSDPLNNLTGILCINFFKKKYFHCTDFSNNRFGNCILNFIYKKIIITSFKKFDLIGIVSLITKNELIKNGCAESKLIYVPNSPRFIEKDLSKKEPFSLICTGGGIIKKYGYEIIIEILFKIKLFFPKVKLYAIGSVSEDYDYYKKIKTKIDVLGLEKNIIFTGFLNPDELEKYLIKSCVGFSFYSKEVQYYTKFGDSLKMREYALYGIPTISDGNSATDQEMSDAGAGFIVKNLQEASEKISSLFIENNKYLKIQKNCINWAIKNDKIKILKLIEERLSLKK